MKYPEESEVFFQAAARNDSAAIDKYLVAGISPNAISENHGHTPLYNACITGSLDSAKSLLAGGADPNLVFSYRSPVDGRLEKAVVALMFVRTTEIAEMLIAAGANVNTTDANGTTPLMRAAFKGSVELVRLLLKAGASPQTRQIKRPKKKPHTARELVESKIEFWKQITDDKNRQLVEKRLLQYDGIKQLLLKAELDAQTAAS